MPSEAPSSPTKRPRRAAKTPKAGGEPQTPPEGTNGSTAHGPKGIDLDPYEAALKQAEAHREEMLRGEEERRARTRARNRRLPKWPKPFKGPMRDAVEATLAASNKPRPCVAMGAVLVGMASAIPGLDCVEDGTRLNLFVSVALDPSGGKDTPRVAAQSIAAAAGVRYEGAPASGAALERLLQSYMSMLLPIDEAAQMQGAKKDKGAQHYSKDLIDVLLKLFSASKSSYSTRAYADSKKGEVRRLIWHPCVNLLMFATDFGVARSLDSGSIRTGELPRQLFVHDNVPVKHRRAPKFTLPESVARIAAQMVLTDNERGALAEPGEKEAAHRHIKESEQATRLLDIVMERHDGKDAYGGDAPLGVMLASRHFEKVLRVAAVLAKWDNPTEPVMTGRHVAWAERFVTACDLAMANYYAEEVHETTQGADVELVRRAMQKALDGGGGKRADAHRDNIREGVVPRHLVMYLAGGMSAGRITKKPFDDAVSTLEALHEVSTGTARLGQRDGAVVLRGEAWEDR